MSGKIAQIRSLLSELEAETEEAKTTGDLRAVSGLEIPEIICEIVDLLMPELKPYEAAIYWNLFRNSILKTGTEYVRVSRRGLQSGVVKSVYAGTQAGGKDAESELMSYGTIQNAFRGLEALGAIRQEGEPGQGGTLYRIILPENIDACIRRRTLSTPSSVSEGSEREADFYNVKENRIKIFERDDYNCTYCGKKLTRFTATIDHIIPVSQGGSHTSENLKTACLQCNSMKTARPLSDFLADKNNL